MRKNLGDSLASAGVKLLSAGVAAAVVLGGIATGVVWGAVSGPGGQACLVGAAVSAVALALGQAIVTASAKASSALTLALALLGYLAALAIIVVTLVTVDRDTAMPVRWAAVGVAAGSAGYLLGAAVMYRHLRILVFGEPASRDRD